MANKALLVGINKYKIPGVDLSGCVNDVTNVRDVLLKFFGFAVKEIRALVDERATKKNIITRLKWLVNKAKAGDRLLFHFSGHGSQVRDRDGDELKDHMDEIICPHDMEWDGVFITDDELREIFSSIPKGANLEVLLDSCHSGTGTREAFAINTLPSEMSFKPRFLAPPIDIACRVDDDLEVKRILKGNSNPINHVLFSGCRDNQTSADAYIHGSYNGAFTYYLCKHLREIQGSITRAELLKRLRASLKFNGFNQTPQLEAPVAERKKKVLE
ncbi:MAG: Caspase-1, p20 [Nitrospirae bacterium CG_4_10_14_0_8_um_filter_41_23]|nr:MAG: Caspase-1, p20 [Nitrospirae bacterium CG11_big_fil_rev_8_21_14_0_20_41_14]PIV42470.1 MAG: Caspase-1, p20 [Nitrospirae bacterium CG02_land_8_20_14_3_00_41_53]PIW87987.1 MAG: Caspase-1, p20 [Nitrospirae bacterium CG_4_8_14_3_um_filter_41_47]PIY87245.1 MAG: Caspase-1, p20 [Nitrospirae bacterium CG_4_10_14_0_8_um_filter_41_23]PJA79311.1 MAG: Caspase-1, p20 [Nitrospirae bacterium CG_4_9_14_3_um_filter_41_27]